MELNDIEKQFLQVVEEGDNKEAIRTPFFAPDASPVQTKRDSVQIVDKMLETWSNDSNKNEE